MSIQPVFHDIRAVYELDYTNVASGSLPVGWRTTDGSSVRDYPVTGLGTGPRTMVGFSGFQGEALYWRNTSAEYGRLTAYPLELDPGHYELIFAMAAWKSTPVYQVNILNSSGKTLKSSADYTASPNLDGNAAGDLSKAERQTLAFDVTTKGKYIIQFKDKTSTGGYHEFLLAECRLLGEVPTAISTVGDDNHLPEGIYSVSGVRRTSLQRGLNIVVTANGENRKVYVR